MLRSLDWFDLSWKWSHFDGSITSFPSLENMAGLTFHNLSSNELSDSIVSEFRMLSLTRLNLEGNQLNGIIAAGFGTYLNLNFDKIEICQESHLGQIPPNLGEAHLSLNQLAGMIPVELGRLTSLNILLLNVNAVSASYSVGIQILAMQRLRVAGNEMVVQSPVN
ncbi:hypothetical protein V6N12_040820 [Hibiscus sabdariffa]|uniref:Uncharacterized protein n=1 Tax=Hibiscus sabdariffa TaxID=183260 RepID=A0ABR2E4U9_9ROSI